MSILLPALLSAAVLTDFFLLQIAGNAVKKASDNLVRAAQKAAFDKADEDNVVVKTKFVGGIAQVILSGITVICLAPVDDCI